MGGYTRKGVLYQGPTMKRGRKKKVIAVVAEAPASKPVSSNVKSAIKRAINNELEVKCAPVLTLADQQPIAGTGLNNATGYGFTAGASIVPALANGPGEATRIGNIVNVKKLVLKYTIQALAVTVAGGTNNFLALPFMARVIVYRHRYANDDNSNIGILDQGATSANLGSTPDLWTEPYNRKEYVIGYSKQFLMQPIANNTATGTVADNVASNTKPFVSGKAIIKMPKKLIYNDVTTIPSNAAWYVAFAVCNIDGTGALNTQFRARCNASSYLYYTDA